MRPFRLALGPRGRERRAGPHLGELANHFWLDQLELRAVNLALVPQCHAFQQHAMIGGQRRLYAASHQMT